MGQSRALVKLLGFKRRRRLTVKNVKFLSKESIVWRRVAADTTKKKVVCNGGKGQGCKAVFEVAD